MTRKALEALLTEEYGAEPEYLFRSSPETAVFRHGHNKKWFAVIMEIAKEKLGLRSSERVTVVNVKCDVELGELLRGEKGIYPAYHMNKRHWLTLVPEEIDEERLRFLLAGSYRLTRR